MLYTQAISTFAIIHVTSREHNCHSYCSESNIFLRIFTPTTLLHTLPPASIERGIMLYTQARSTFAIIWMTSGEHNCHFYQGESNNFQRLLHPQDDLHHLPPASIERTTLCFIHKQSYELPFGMSYLLE